MSLFPKFKTNIDLLATSATSATRTPESRESRESRNPIGDEVDYRSLYGKAAAAVCDDCFLIDACWLIDRHPELWQQMRDLDDRLTEMEQQGFPESEYQSTLAQLVVCVQDVRAIQDREQARQRPAA